MKTSCISFIIFLSLATVSVDSNNDVNITCEVDKCSQCYSKLVENVLQPDGNMFNITRTFFPPDTAPPVYVIVYYDYKNDSNRCCEEETWFWSTSTFYHFLPLSILQYMSLFFTDPAIRVKHLYLTLDLECINPKDGYMELLTQRLQLYAEEYSTVPNIDTSYQPKAISVDTFIEWLSEHNDVASYLLAVQISLPLFILIGSVLAIIYFLFAEPHKFGEKIVKLAKSPDNKGWLMKTNLYIALSMSTMFSTYVFIMVIIGIRLGVNNNPQELKHWTDNEDKELETLFGVSDCIPVLDGLVFGASLILFISSMFVGAKKLWYLCIYSLLNPITNLAIHSTLITIGFIHNLYHATAVMITYGLTILTCVAVLRIISQLIYAFRGKPNSEDKDKWLLILFMITLIIECGIVAFVVILYFKIPINIAFDDTPNRILTVYQSLVVLFMGLLTYLIVSKPSKSVMDLLIQAKDTQNKDQGGGQSVPNTEEQGGTSDRWDKLTYHRKEEEIAKDMLTVLENLKKNPIQVKEKEIAEDMLKVLEELQN